MRGFALALSFRHIDSSYGESSTEEKVEAVAVNEDENSFRDHGIRIQRIFHLHLFGMPLETPTMFSTRSVVKR